MTDFTRNIPSEAIAAIIPFNPQYHAVSSCEYGEPLVYSRLNRVAPESQWRIPVLGVVFGIGMIIWMIGIVLFLVRRKKHPLRERSPGLLMVSALAGTFVLAYMYLRTFFDLVLVCPISYYIIHACIPLYVLPYLFRCYRTIMLWKLNQTKARLMNVDPQHDASSHELKERGNDSHEGVVDDEGNHGDALEEKYFSSTMGTASSPTTPTEATFVEDGTKEESSLVEQKEKEKRHLSMAKKTTLTSSMFSKFKKTTKRFQGFGAGRSQWVVKNRFFYSEKFLVLLLAIIFILWTMLGILLQVILWTAGNLFNPICQKTCNFQEGFYLRTLIGLVCIVMLINIAMIVAMRKMNDDFSIRNELAVVCIVSTICDFAMLVMAFIPGMFWPDQPYVGYILALLIVGCLIISVFWPTLQTFTRHVDLLSRFRKIDTLSETMTTSSSSSSLTESSAQNNNNNNNNNNSSTNAMTAEQGAKKPKPKPKKTQGKMDDFEYFLKNGKAKECFKQFLVREFSVENLMFYTECQYFRTLVDKYELSEAGQQIFDTYLQYGAPFEINVNDQVRTSTENKMQESVTVDLFAEAEEVVFQVMKLESFTRFKKSKLYQTFLKERSKK